MFSTYIYEKYADLEDHPALVTLSVLRLLFKSSGFPSQTWIPNIRPLYELKSLVKVCPDYRMNFFFINQ